ncbi:signal peptidase I [Candidatus Woesearchaeota archaeon]|nr:signal peptidase I [Candidatus Woesearchaeota archaeon]
MEHDSSNFELWWEYNKVFYINRNITKEEFREYAFHNGFNKGDIMILRGYNPENIEIGDVIVFRAGKAYPIIHRVVEKNGHFGTKGDNNPDQIRSFDLDETNIKYEQLIGKAVFRIPWVGYVKIGAVELVSSLKG